jgi:hypothetical protein
MLLARTPANSITFAPEITLWLIIVKDILIRIGFWLAQRLDIRDVDVQPARGLLSSP